jgi:hypothetical protein
MRFLLAVVFALLLTAAPAYADEKPPPKDSETGCCFSFNNSPVNLVFCTTADACRFGVPK